jgi:hypothetical protein
MKKDIKIVRLWGIDLKPKEKEKQKKEVKIVRLWGIDLKENKYEVNK